MTTVVAAIIELEQRILVCQRSASGPHAGKWEFPGGKVEAGESPEKALERELNEELGISAILGPEVARYEFSYPGKTPILLVFYAVEEFEGKIKNNVFARIEWSTRNDLIGYDFLEGDAEIVRLLRGRLD